MTFNYGGVHYPSGEFSKTKGIKDNLPNSTLPYEVNFVSSGFPDVYKINRDADGNAMSVDYTFFAGTIESEIMIYFIYDEGFKINNIMIITN